MTTKAVAKKEIAESFQQGQELRDKLEGARGKLSSLDPKAAADLEKIKEENLNALRTAFEQRSSSTLAELLGRGVESSTIAGDIQGRLIRDQGLVEGQELSANAQRVLGLRQFLTTEDRSNLALQLDALSSERNAATSLINTYTQASAARAVASIGAESRIKVAEIGSEASKFGALKAYQASIYGSDAQLAGTRYAASQSANATRAAALLRLQGVQYSTDAQLNIELARLEEGSRQFNQDLGFRYYGADLEADLRREGYASDYSIADLTSARNLQAAQYGADQQRRASRNSAALGALGAIIGGIGAAAIFASDERLKYNIQPISNPIDKLNKINGVTWYWKRDIEETKNNPLLSGGVVAQEVFKVMPEAVRPLNDKTGYFAVDYNMLIGLLIESVKMLASEVTLLKDKIKD